jgi:hypothetical protein
MQDDKQALGQLDVKFADAEAKDNRDWLADIIDPRLVFLQE